MKFETKYNVKDKVFYLKHENIESYIKQHPYDDPLEILESCFCKDYVRTIYVEFDVCRNKPIISYFITPDCCMNKCSCPEDVNIIYEQDLFSNLDGIKNMIKETHKNILNNLKHKTEEILKKYE